MKKILVLIIMLFAIGQSLPAQTAAQRQGQFNLGKNKLAVQGYDVLGYFNEGKAYKGKSDFQHTFNGVTYWFANAAHRDQFALHPDWYEPQYGGWCAYAMGATGEKVTIDPGTFKIQNGKLLLFYNAFLNNTLTTWNKDPQNLQNQADANWGKFLK